MIGTIQINEKDPIAILKSVIKTIKMHRVVGAAASTEELIFDDMRSNIESAFGIKIPNSVETFKFTIPRTCYESPIGGTPINDSKPYSVYVGPKDLIDGIVERVSLSGMGWIGEYQEEIFCGFVSDDALLNFARNDFLLFVEWFEKSITNNFSESNPWEIYNRIVDKLACVEFTKGIDKELCTAYMKDILDRVAEFTYKRIDASDLADENIIDGLITMTTMHAKRKDYCRVVRCIMDILEILS